MSHCFLKIIKTIIKIYGGLKGCICCLCITGLSCTPYCQSMQSSQRLTFPIFGEEKKWNFWQSVLLCCLPRGHSTSYTFACDPVFSQSVCPSQHSLCPVLYECAMHLLLVVVTKVMISSQSLIYSINTTRTPDSTRTHVTMQYDAGALGWALG